MNGFERVASMDSLYRSWQKISSKNASGGIDGIDLSFYRSDLQKNLRLLQTAVASGSYRPYAEKTYANHKDRQIEANSVFFSRYVDDMLVAPVGNIELIKTSLAEVGLEINTEKSRPVNAAEGFKYLGFDIKRDIGRAVDAALQSGDFALAEELYETQVG